MAEYKHGGGELEASNNSRINALRSEIYILLIDDLYLDYAKAEIMVAANIFITGGKQNPATIKKINHKFLQIKELQSVNDCK